MMGKIVDLNESCSPVSSPWLVGKVPDQNGSCSLRQSFVNGGFSIAILGCRRANALLNVISKVPFLYDYLVCE